MRTVCERDGIPVQMANEGNLSLWHLRETQALVNWVRGRGPEMLVSADVMDWLDRQPAGQWVELLRQAADEHDIETAGAQVLAASFIEWLAEWARDARRHQDGLLLLTAHRAKGLEFDHVVVLDGGWDRADGNEGRDAERCLYYVAMTRARHTLALARRPGAHPFQDALRDNPSVHWRDPLTLPPETPELARRYRRLTLSDVNLGFAGRKPPDDATHRAIAELAPGDHLRVQPHSARWQLRNYAGVVVGTLARKFTAPTDKRCTGATVLAVATWSRDRSDPQYRQRLENDSWEVVIPELVFEPSRSRVAEPSEAQR